MKTQNGFTLFEKPSEIGRNRKILRITQFESIA